MESGGVSLVKEKVVKEKIHDVSAIAKQTAIFSWKDVTYEFVVSPFLIFSKERTEYLTLNSIKIKGEPRRILDHVDGWVKPGTLTALMGVSG